MKALTAASSASRAARARDRARATILRVLASMRRNFRAWCLTSSAAKWASSPLPRYMVVTPAGDAVRPSIVPLRAPDLPSHVFTPPRDFPASLTFVHYTGGNSERSSLSRSVGTGPGATPDISLFRYRPHSRKSLRQDDDPAWRGGRDEETPGHREGDRGDQDEKTRAGLLAPARTPLPGPVGSLAREQVLTPEL